MKKNIVTLIIAICLISCMGNQSNKKLNNDYSQMNLKGSVKSVIETRYGAIRTNGQLQKGTKQNTRIYNFNPEGNLIEISGDPDMASGSWEKQEFKYNETGKKIECTVYNNDGSVQGRAVYKHGPDGNIIEENRYSQNYPKQGEVIYQGKIIYTYDNNRNKIQEDTYRNDGTPGDKTTYKYDANGNMIERKTENHIYSCKYDDNGNVIEDKLEGRTKYTYVYDKTNNWTQKAWDGYPDGGPEGPMGESCAVFVRQIIYY